MGEVIVAVGLGLARITHEASVVFTYEEEVAILKAVDKRTVGRAIGAGAGKIFEADFQDPTVVDIKAEINANE